MTGSRKGKISSQLPGQQCSADFPFAGWVRLSGLRKLCPDTDRRENPATWIEMLHLSSSYECMIHFSGTPSPGSEGFETARLSLVIHGDGTTAYLQGGGWHIISGLTATMNIWQTNQLDVDLDAQTWSWSIGGASSGTIIGFGNTPGNTAASITFRGGSSNNDLFYVDALQVETPMQLSCRSHPVTNYYRLIGR